MGAVPRFRIRVPASTSNLGPAFDTFSVALSLFLEITAVASGGAHHEWLGDWPVGDRNVFADALSSISEKLGISLPPLRFSSRNDIPLKRGLGSSAAAITAGILTGCHLAKVQLDVSSFLEIALPLEGHPDNLAAAWQGGWVLCWQDGPSTRIEALPVKGSLVFVVAIPELRVSTSRAREVLPKQYRMRDVVHTVQRSTLLLHALYRNDKELIIKGLQDRIHQPYREALIPGSSEILAGKDLPAAVAPDHWGVYLSGSGSTICSLTDDHAAGDAIGAWMVGQFQEAGIKASYRILKVSHVGAQILE